MSIFKHAAKKPEANDEVDALLAKAAEKVEAIAEKREAAQLVTGTGMEPLAPIDAAAHATRAHATRAYPGHRPECVRQTAQNAVCNCGVS